MKIDELYQSQWIKATDLGRPITATIKSVEMRPVRGNEEKPVLVFAADTKPMILNRTNAMIVAGLYGNETRKWIGKPIVLYSAEVELYDGQKVEAVRVRAPSASEAKDAPDPEVNHDDVPF